MAYGNWGAFVYRNGERQTDREDQTPYSEQLTPASSPAFGGYAAGAGAAELEIRTLIEGEA